MPRIVTSQNWCFAFSIECSTVALLFQCVVADRFHWRSSGSLPMSLRATAGRAKRTKYTMLNNNRVLNQPIAPAIFIHTDLSAGAMFEIRPIDSSGYGKKNSCAVDSPSIQMGNDRVCEFMRMVILRLMNEYHR